MKQLKAVSAFAVIVALAAAAPANATVNLLTNGSFETSNFTGWTLSGSATDGYSAVVIPYNSNAGYPNGAFNEPVPAPTGSLSPDSAGAYGAYFVSDFSNETLTQSVTLGAGTYKIGLSLYAPANGFANAGDAAISAAIGGVHLIDTTVHSLTKQTWYNLTGTLVVTSPGVYAADFNFRTNSFPSADVVIDQAYVTPVPEISTWAMMIAGFSVLGFAGYRRKSATVAA